MKGVSHLSRRARRRLYCQLQLWMWRQWREKCFGGFMRCRRLVQIRRYRSGLSIGPQRSKKNVDRCPSPVQGQSQMKTSTLESDLGHASKTKDISPTSDPPGTVPQTTSAAPESVAEYAFEVTRTGLDSHVTKRRNGVCEQKLAADQSGRCAAAHQKILYTKISSKNETPPQIEVGPSELTDSIDGMNCFIYYIYIYFFKIFLFQLAL